MGWQSRTLLKQFIMHIYMFIEKAIYYNNFTCGYFSNATVSPVSVSADISDLKETELENRS